MANRHALGAGFTGSWIFSQTLFSARAGVAHRWAHGAAIAALELGAFAAPFSIIRFLPASFVAALLLVFACYGFSPDAFSYVFRSEAGFLWFSLDPARRFFATLGNAGVTVASAASLVLYLGLRKSRYFGNTAPLLCALALFLLVMKGAPGAPWLWALPFLLTFVGGVFADAYEGPRGRLAMAAGGAILLLQAVFCVLSLPGLL